MYKGKNIEIILFAVLGKVPAILTETIWALSRLKPPVIPNRIVVVTTKVGADFICSELFTPNEACKGQTVWESLRSSLESRGHNLDGRLQFGTTANDIKIITAVEKNHVLSQELDDIRTSAANQATANFILETLRTFTETAQTRIIASIAGGRKTMGALLYACMNLVGRETDQVMHVLASQPFDDAYLTPRFYFPGQPRQTLKDTAGKTYLAKKAVIELADIPFVPLRNRLPNLFSISGNFSQIVHGFSLSHDNIPPVTLEIDLNQSQVTVDGVNLKLRKRSILALKFLAQINQTLPLPRGQLEAHDLFCDFLKNQSDTYARDWAIHVSVDDLKREISALRKTLASAGLNWAPGLRSESLKLPPFLTP